MSFDGAWQLQQQAACQNPEYYVQIDFSLRYPDTCCPAQFAPLIKYHVDTARPIPGLFAPHGTARCRNNIDERWNISPLHKVQLIHLVWTENQARQPRSYVVIHERQHWGHHRARYCLTDETEKRTITEIKYQKVSHNLHDHALDDSSCCKGTVKKNGEMLLHVEVFLLQRFG